LVEVMVALGLGSLVLATVGALSLYGARSSIAIVNYTDLDARSRSALDVTGRDIRQAVALLAFETNLPVRSMTFASQQAGQTLKISWDSRDRTVVLERTGQPRAVVLTECDRWDFSLYKRVPRVTATNVFFYPATNVAGQLDPKLCKLINMTWKCSRQIRTQKVNTESVQTAQIVLRNKQ
jgi:hypothetical protein